MYSAGNFLVGQEDYLFERVMIARSIYSPIILGGKMVVCQNVNFPIPPVHDPCGLNLAFSSSPCVLQSIC